VQFAVSLFDVAFLASLVAAAIAKRAFGTRVVTTSHEVLRELELLGPAGRLLHHWIGRLSDEVVVYTDESRDLLIRRCGVPPARIAVLPLGMSPRRQTPPPKEKSETEPPLLLCFGFLHPDKGIETLIEAARQLRDAGSPPAFRVLIAGDVRARRGVFRLFGRSDRKYRDDLHRRVTSAGLDELITFSGYVGDDRLEELMASAHLVIAPYLRTTQSAAVNRAAGAGAAIVASDLPGLRASLGDAARWVPPNDPLALANALGSLLTDLGEVARLRRCALDAYEEHSMAKAAARLSHLWLSQAEITT
jgi:glycosyltransferase involved in cell wall biosynthesis